jgi:hypothetical protein
VHADLRHIWVFTHSVQWEVGGGAEGAEQREVPVGNGRWVARGGGWGGLNISNVSHGARNVSQFL